jgi:hypothetical protein
MIARLDKLQAEQLSRFIAENHDRIEGGIAVTDSRPMGTRSRAGVTGFRRDGKATCEGYLFGRRK